MVISRRRFAENGKEMYRNQKKQKGEQSFCFGSLNMQKLWRCRYRRLADLKHEGALYKDVFPGRIEAHLSVTVLKCAGQIQNGGRFESKKGKL